MPSLCALKNNNMSKVENFRLHSLDTLEITSDFSKGQSHASQYHKALRKHSTIQKLVTIIDAVKAPEIKKKYWATYHCQSVLLQDGNRFTGSLCRKRWCSHCCRIKTAEMTNGYKAPLQELGNLYFVTLTRPNVKARQLKSEVAKMIKGFQRIKDNLRKTYGIKLNGIRKIEVTYNEQADTYHPHFHFIQSDQKHAYALQKLWLDQFSNANIKAQDIRPINTTNDDSFIELFKYATKETTKSGKSYTGEVLHNIYSALEGKRIYQTYGTLKKVKEPAEAKAEKAVINWIEPKMDIWIWDNDKKDWLDENDQELVRTLDHQATEKRIEKTLILQSYATNKNHVKSKTSNV